MSKSNKCPNPLCSGKVCECAKYYAQLDAEGLSDLDVELDAETTTVSNRGAGKLDDDLDAAGRAQSEELQDEARDIDRHHYFPTSRDHEIWVLLVDGKSIRETAKVLGTSFRQIKKSIDATRRDWRAAQRRPPKLTKDLVEATDPDVLLALLDVMAPKAKT